MSAMALNLKRMAKAIFSAIYMDKMWAENMISQPIFYLCQQVQKYVIPNIPYLFILWACLKLGTAYRLAPGADFAHKLMGLGQIGRAHV